MSLIEILVIVTVIDRLLVKNALNHSLNQAVLKHTKELILEKKKPFICKECSKAFTKSGDLKTHLRTQSGEKPFICKECSNAFSKAFLNPAVSKHT